MTDFFISYTHADTSWAEWIGYVLEEEGFNVVIQAWDFRPGSNFVMEMQRAATEATRTMMVLSPDYLQSQFASPEWAAAFGQDPQGRDLKLVPVMVHTCQPTGLLPSIVQIRIVGMDENTARRTLLAGIDKKRAKPSARPAFPGVAAQVQHKAFPGPASAVEPSPTIEKDPESRDDWQPVSSMATPLAEAILHQPTPTNRGGNYHLNATVRFDAAEQNDGDRAVVIGLREAVLSIAALGFQFAQNSLIGERTPHPHIQAGVRGVIIKGPLINGQLRGNPVSEDYLVTIEPGTPGNNTVTITVSAAPRAFTFAYAPDPDTPPIAFEQKPNRAAVLSLLLGEAMPKDSQGRLVLAAASLRHKASE